MGAERPPAHRPAGPADHAAGGHVPDRRPRPPSSASRPPSRRTARPPGRSRSRTTSGCTISTRADFGGVVCDESSAIKAFDGARRAIVTDFLRKMPYRLLCTATAAPNDYIELGTSSEALGYLGHMDMLARFFTNRTGHQQGLRRLGGGDAGGSGGSRATPRSRSGGGSSPGPGPCAGPPTSGSMTPGSPAAAGVPAARHRGPHTGRGRDPVRRGRVRAPRGARRSPADDRRAVRAGRRTA